MIYFCQEPNFIRKEELKNKSTEDLYLDYKNSNGKVQDNILEELLYIRHKNLIYQIAWKFYRQNPHILDIEDCIQYGRLGAIQGYKTFDTNKNVKLISYIGQSAHWGIQNGAHESQSISCPSKMKQMRSYLTGKYDYNPDKKKKVEEEYHLVGEKDIENIRKKYIGLTVHITTFTDLLKKESETEKENKEDILSNYLGEAAYFNKDSEYSLMKIDIENAAQKLTKIQQKIFQLYFKEDFGVTDISKILQLKASYINNELRNIRLQIQLYCNGKKMKFKKE